MFNRLTKIALLALALPAILLPLACMGYLIYQGLPELGNALFSSTSQNAGFSGQQNILPQLTGSLALSLIACIIAFPLALGLALYQQLYANSLVKRLLQHTLTTFQSIPPLVFGLCGLIVFVHLLSWGISLAAGALVLALIILPLLTLNTLNALERIPSEYTESAQALGMSAAQIIWHVWRPRAWRSLVTGLFLAIARTLSETAPILFTAAVFSGVSWPDSLFSPVTSLQTHIFYLAQEAVDEQAVARAWSSALLLVMLVIGFSLLAQRVNKATLRSE